MGLLKVIGIHDYVNRGLKVIGRLLSIKNLISNYDELKKVVN